MPILTRCSEFTSLLPDSEVLFIKCPHKHSGIFLTDGAKRCNGENCVVQGSSPGSDGCPLFVFNETLRDITDTTVSLSAAVNILIMQPITCSRGVRMSQLICRRLSG